ncbi:YihY/virulence factor BrkB family protein [Roseateles albus]|uniref:YihY/virulence factor BrkB family protein n=1 Tax=Roseateles albus TaxID=2987525 RepID=A0ABT5KBL2_9BURK|nr:YihY/virulence factor BrkB family protein [Roseateles albus]MDC8771190.1 YihY/virulence factor BrkB family protein [Roseateles albus]
MRHKLRQIGGLLRAAALNWVRDYAQSMGAALAFYTIFSIAPLLLIVISLAGLVFGEEAARGEIYDQLQALLGSPGAIAVQDLIESAGRPSESLMTAGFGLLFLFIGATSVFTELQDALNRIWRAPQKEKVSGLWALLRARLLSFGMILGIGFLLIVSLAFSAGLAALSRWWDPSSVGWLTLARVSELTLGLGASTLIFALIYKSMPRAQVQWADVWVGALVTSLLFAAGKSLIGSYIGHSGVSTAFGAAASLIVVLLYVYYSAQIFLFGAEFTWVYAHRFGSRRGHVLTPDGSVESP